MSKRPKHCKQDIRQIPHDFNITSMLFAFWKYETLVDKFVVVCSDALVS